jgi:DNA-binding response OmpR family regulator
MTSSSPVHTLLVEDDLRLAQLTRTYLERQGVTVTHCGNGADALSLAMRHHFDVILLDLMLPGLDGLEVCKRLRAHRDTPIIMLTARGEEADRVMGLELGADDYLPKPFSPRELLARVRAIVRRSRGEAGPRAQPLSLGPLHLDPATRVATLDDTQLDLTSYEFDLLFALASHPGLVLSRERLMDLARGDSTEAFDRAVDVHVSRLRRKLNDDPQQPRLIRTVRGVGYQFILKP